MVVKLAKLQSILAPKWYSSNNCGQPELQSMAVFKEILGVCMQTQNSFFPILIDLLCSSSVKVPRSAGCGGQ